MQREVYLDVYFIINFAIDCISLYICGIALKRRSTFLKLSVSSSIGAIWAVFELFIDIGEVYDFLISTVVCTLMIIVAYKVCSFYQLIKYIMCCIAINSVFSGFYILVHNYILCYVTLTDKMLVVCLTIFISGIISILFIKFLLRSSKAAFIRVRITINGKTATFKAVIDSCNLLKDPISGVGIAFIDFDAALKLFEYNEAVFLSGTLSDDPVLAEKYKVRPVVLKTVNNSSVVYIIKPEMAVMEKNDNESIKINIYLSVSKESFSPRTAECILPNYFDNI